MVVLEMMMVIKNQYLILWWYWSKCEQDVSTLTQSMFVCDILVCANLIIIIITIAIIVIHSKNVMLYFVFNIKADISK